MHLERQPECTRGFVYPKYDPTPPYMYFCPGIYLITDGTISLGSVMSHHLPCDTLIVEP